MTTEERLARLERENRWMQVGRNLSAVGFTLLFTVGCASKPLPAPPERPYRIRAYDLAHCLAAARSLPGDSSSPAIVELLVLPKVYEENHHAIDQAMKEKGFTPGVDSMLFVPYVRHAVSAVHVGGYDEDKALGILQLLWKHGVEVGLEIGMGGIYYMPPRRLAEYTHTVLRSDARFKDCCTRTQRWDIFKE